MHLNCLLTTLSLSLLLPLLNISLGYEIQKRNFDSARNYPAQKVSFYNRSKPYQPHGKVVKVKSGDLKFNKKFKREHADNVKGELKPQSREDIYNIKRLSFHGRNSPNSPEALVGENITYSHHQVPTTTSQPSFYSEPIQRNDYYIPRSHKSSKPIKKSVSSSVDNQVVTTKPPRYVPHSDKFHPLMRPSPINVMPTEPPSFDTVRNYVRYLKMRQQKYFSDFDDDNDGGDEEKPAPVEAALAQPKISAPFAGEIDYFKEREIELAHEEQRRNQFSPADFGTNDRISDVDSDDLLSTPFKAADEDENSDDYAYESEITRGDNRNSAYDNNDDEEEEEEEEEDVIDNKSNGGGELREYYGDDGEEEESRKSESFVPFRLYAQVRHMEADHHEKPKKKNIKEKVSLAKKNIYYKEEGYEDKTFDQGLDKVNFNYDENIKDYAPKYIRKRVKRSADADESIDVSKLPVALAYIKKSELPSLTGVKLLRHLDELLKNSSVYLPDDDDTQRPVKIASPKKHSPKYPYYNFPSTVLSQMSAHRYSENLKNYPRQKESLYKLKNIKRCEAIAEDIDPVPSDIEEQGKSTSFNNKPKRLRGLGDKIECLREKYFGRDPFDNPLFHENDDDDGDDEEYVAATIPIPVNHSLSRQANPLITVYDDVINNIRSGFLDEFKKEREAQDALKAASEQITIKAEQTKIPNLSAVVSIGNSFPLFDINNFTPKFRGAINHDLIDGIDDLDDAQLRDEGSAAAELLKINKQQLLLENDKLRNANYRSAEITERPKVKRNNKHASSDYIEDISPPLPPPKSFPSAIRSTQAHRAIKNPQLTFQKFRRLAPNTIPYPTKHISSSIFLPQKPASKTTYRFKLL